MSNPYFYPVPESERKPDLTDSPCFTEFFSRFKQNVETVTEGIKVARTNAQKMASYQEQVDLILAKMANLKKYPEEDPCNHGDVIMFNRRYPRSENYYTFVAIKVGQLYYTTGSGKKEPCVFSWSELVDWMGEYVDEVFLMTAAHFDPKDGSQTHLYVVGGPEDKRYYKGKYENDGLSPQTINATEDKAKYDFHFEPDRRGIDY